MILNTKQINYRIFYALLFLGAASGAGRFQLVEIEDDYGEADGAIDPTPDAGAANGKRVDCAETAKYMYVMYLSNLGAVDATPDALIDEPAGPLSIVSYIFNLVYLSI